MDREDPLERIEREERERKERNTDLRKVMWILIAVAGVLAAALIFVTMQKSKLVGELNEEKQDLAEQIMALKCDYDSLSVDFGTISGDNETLRLQLDSSREEVTQLVERIQKADAANRAQIRKYEKELGTLRTIMRSYIVQIDSLNTLNHKLTVDAANARKEAAESKKANEVLTARIEDLSGQVATGSVLKARGFKLEAYDSRDRVTDRSSRVKYMSASLSLVENSLAPKGWIRVYIRLLDEQGNLLTDGSGASFTFNGQPMQASASREVDYEGSEVDMSIFLNNIEFHKGSYSMEAYTTQARLGGTEVYLR